MTHEEREAMKAELRAELLQEMTQRKSSATAAKMVMDEFAEDYKKFDRPTYNGEMSADHYKVKQAVSALVRLHFGCDYIDRIPPEKLDDARTMIRRILDACLPAA
jgi:hypothetical protein